MRAFALFALAGAAAAAVSEDFNEFKWGETPSLRGRALNFGDYAQPSASPSPSGASAARRRLDDASCYDDASWYIGDSPHKDCGYLSKNRRAPRGSSRGGPASLPGWFPRRLDTLPPIARRWRPPKWAPGPRAGAWTRR